MKVNTALFQRLSGFQRHKNIVGMPLRRFQRYLEKTLGFTIPLAFGRGIFMPWGLLPYPVPLNIVVGAPIEVEKYEEAGSGRGGAVFEALVDKYHRQYVTALLELFDQHKEKFAKDAADMRLLE